MPDTKRVDEWKKEAETKMNVIVDKFDDWFKHLMTLKDMDFEGVDPDEITAWVEIKIKRLEKRIDDLAEKC